MYHSYSKKAMNERRHKSVHKASSSAYRRVVIKRSLSLAENYNTLKAVAVH